jgi:hypothetical protein
MADMKKEGVRAEAQRHRESGLLGGGRIYIKERFTFST